ncbi:MAG: GtrA family protein [Candidatus Saccharimonadales bacterium]
MNSIRTLLQKPGARYLVVGGSVYVLELIVIFAAQRLGATAVQAVTISFLVGLVVSFLLQKLFTFGDRRMYHKVVIAQVVAVTALVLWNLGFTIVVTRLLQDVLPAVVTRTLALGITTIWNFYLYRTRIFRQSDHEEILVD